jgi:hypothetical protein
VDLTSNGSGPSSDITPYLPSWAAIMRAERGEVPVD